MLHHFDSNTRGFDVHNLNHPKPLLHESTSYRHLPPGCWRYHSERFAANIQLRLLGFMWATCESLITWEYLQFFTKGGGVNHLKKKVRWCNFWCQSYVIYDVIIWQLDDSELIMCFSALTFWAKTSAEHLKLNYDEFTFFLGFSNLRNLLWFTLV